MNIEIEKRFWDNTNVDGLNDCWEWMGPLHPDGFGLLFYKFETLLAHHVSWKIHYRKDKFLIPIFKSCNNAPCVNPRHLENALSITRIKRRIKKRTKLNVETGCWEWTGTTHKKYEYGKIQINKKDCLVHRVSWEIFNKQKIPSNMYVLHHCDNPKCMNPKHLFLGTKQDNFIDMIKKGRRIVHGESSPFSKLTEQDVLKIRSLWKSKNYTQQNLADMYKVYQSCISDIVNCKTWAYLENENDKR